MQPRLPRSSLAGNFAGIAFPGPTRSEQTPRESQIALVRRTRFFLQLFIFFAFSLSRAVFFSFSQGGWVQRLAKFWIVMEKDSVIATPLVEETYPQGLLLAGCVISRKSGSWLARAGGAFSHTSTLAPARPPQSGRIRQKNRYHTFT